ncbi:MAG: DUF3089 domain-containing protein [Flavobacteriales bacterium]
MFWLVVMIALSSCFTPHRNFEKYITPPAPDYANENNWSALPWRKDSADVVPKNSGLKENQANAQADVFYVYPTTYYSGKGWNASLANQKINKRTDALSVKHQASVFNEMCKVYAPRYRQATLYSFMDNKGNGHKALDLAYADVKRAFEYYLKNYNKGRPFIIASHSQGTWHAARLITDFIEKDSVLRQRIIAAYLIGGNVAIDMYATLEPCDSATQTRCYVAWHTMKWDTKLKKLKKRMKNTPGSSSYGKHECVNPLTWKRDTVYAPASLNLGSVPFTFNKVYKGKVDAKCVSTQLWTHKSKLKGFPKGKNYHVADYGLYYMNIRENVKQRVEEYGKGK